jgi:hypothetical protein
MAQCRNSTRNKAQKSIKNKSIKHKKHQFGMGFDTNPKGKSVPKK